MRKTALIAVDVQNDFLPDGGALGVEDGLHVIDPLLQLAKQVDLVVASRDWHPENHMSFDPNPAFEDGSWPVHCVQNTPGADVDPAIHEVAHVNIFKGDDPEVEAYSAFDGHDADGNALVNILHDNSITHVIVGGLATDYCVKATAIDAADAGFHTTVYRKAVRGVGDESSRRALKDMADLGVRVTDEDPRGDRPMTYAEAVQDAIDQLVEMAEDAEGGNLHDLSAWYGEVCKWVREREKRGSGFTLTLPDPYEGRDLTVIEVTADRHERIADEGVADAIRQSVA